MSTLKKLLVLLLVIISIATVAGLSACVTLTPTATPTTLSATQAGGSGTIRVEGALDGVSWHGPVNFTLTQQSGGSQTYSGNYSGSGNSVSSQYNGVPLGNYLVAWVSGGPSGGPPTSITAMQSLTDNGTITFVMGWSTLATTAPVTTPPVTTPPVTTPPATTPPATTPPTTTPPTTTPPTTTPPAKLNADVTGTWTGTCIENGYDWIPGDVWVGYFNVTINITNQRPVENYGGWVKPGDDIVDFSLASTWVRSEGHGNHYEGPSNYDYAYCIVSGSTLSWVLSSTSVILQVSGNTMSGSDTGTIVGYPMQCVRGTWDLKRVN